jgi:hypothetical protein
MFKTPVELNIISIDPSLRSTGVFTCQEGKCKAYTFARKEERIALLGLFAKHFARVAKETKWDLCLIEGYSFGSHSSSVTVAAEVGGIIRASFSAFGIPIIEVPPMTWKSITGLAKLKMPKVSVQNKRDYLNYCIETFGFTFDTTDEADAFYIFLATMQASRGNVKKGVGSNIRTRLEELKIKM